MSKQSDLVTVSQGAAGDPLFIDTANNRVGIGTSSPSALLDIQGSDATFEINTTSGVINVFKGQFAGAERASLVVNGSGEVVESYGVSGNSYYKRLVLNGTERMRIDSAGRVTMPYQPAFSAYGLNNPATSGYVTTLPAYLLFGSTPVNNGNHYNTSNGRFTAPVAGLYYFSFSILVDDNANSGSVTFVDLYVNGVFAGFRAYDQNPGSRYQQTSQSAVLYMNAGDYANCYGQAGYIHTGGESAFTGFLIG